MDDLTRYLLHAGFELPVPEGSIRGDLRCLDSKELLPVVIVCHGFKGFKDWGFHPVIGESLAHAGFAAISINFSGSGIGSDLLTFRDLGAFEANTLSKEKSELQYLLDVLCSGELFGRFNLDRSKFGLVGHSRGGYSVLTVGSQDPRVKAIATLASIATLEVDSARAERWRRNGREYAVNQRTKEKLPLGLDLLEDLLKNRDAIETALRVSQIPLKIFHGTADDAVPVASAMKLAEWATHASISIIDGADHVFGARHPYQGMTPDLSQVIHEMAAFFELYLGSPSGADRSEQQTSVR